MSDLPQVTGKEAVKAFSKHGFALNRIKGSHHILKKDGHRYLLSVPCHSGKILGKGLLSNLIQSAGITIDEFVSALDA
jgi:predicted RNA binding protein YcfA (HicA-like mRNA interferase family)